MGITLKKLNIFSKNKDQNQNSGRTKTFLGNLSKGIMTVVALMPIFGLLLGVGAAVTNIGHEINPDSTIPVEIGNLMQNIGGILFANLGLFFAIGLAIAFTNISAMAAMSAVVFYFVFCATQATFIHNVSPLKDGISIEIFYGLWSGDLAKYAVSSGLGFKYILQSGVLGGIVVGALTAWSYNKFKNTKLPTMFAFFSGERFVPILCTGLAILLGALFLVVYPAIGFAFNKIGDGLNVVPFGISAFVFGFVERSLVPFGLHHVFYAPLWWTQAGGSVGQFDDIWINGVDIGTLDSFLKGQNATYDGSKWQGDSLLWLSLRQYGLPFNPEIIHFTKGGATGEIYKLNLGQYQQGKYPFMIFGLPAAAVAMIMCSDKENRKEATGIIGAAALTTFFTGITEPIEFTFLFLAPLLFWGFHAFFCAVSFMIMSNLNVHIGMTFSGGLFDYIVYGILPNFGTRSAGGTSWNQQNNAYWVPIVGLFYIPIYFGGFYYFINRFNIQTPGRTGTSVTLFSKKDYLASKEARHAEKNEIKEQRSVEVSRPNAAQVDKSHKDYVSSVIYDAVGGNNNVTNVSNCASRLRIIIVDKSKVDVSKLKAETKAYGTQWVGQELQIIYGPLVAMITTNFNEYRKTK